MAKTIDKKFAELMQDGINDDGTIQDYALDEAIEFIKSNFNPEDIFDGDQLASWARHNGYDETAP